MDLAYEEYIVNTYANKRGYSNRAIAKELCIDRRTVAKSLKRII